MAYYAFLGQNNIVTEVISGIDETDTSQNWEEWYGNYRGQVCKRTSYNTHGGVYYDPVSKMPSLDQSKAFRKNYAGIGYFYNYDLDGFIPPKLYPSWLLNTTSCLWEPPVPYPTDGQSYVWNEEKLSWDIVNEN